MRGSIRMTPAASMTKVGKWAIMGLPQPNKSDEGRYAPAKEAAPAFLGQSSVLSCHPSRQAVRAGERQMPRGGPATRREGLREDARRGRHSTSGLKLFSARPATEATFVASVADVADQATKAGGRMPTSKRFSRPRLIFE